MKYILIALAVFHFSSGQAQINWTETSNWRLYRISGSTLFSISADSLSLVKGYPMRSDSIAAFLDSVQPLPRDVKPLWMGGAVASCVYNGKTRKILISGYGGFFLDQTSGAYFQLPAQKKNDWNDYINRCLLAL